MLEPEMPSPALISIHAPTRGATKTYETKTSVTEFQSTLPRGERLGELLDLKKEDVFQSTLPRGERRTLTM